ncbi:MAG: accessory gene regulator B family protein [Lachnospiraceae bacterium]|nr:accessory gene regulator B family protein [Lachnospiraceae bacterium]
MERLAEFLANYILKEEAISEKDYEIYKYGFQIGAEMFICMVVCYFLAIQMNMAGECTVFFFLFFSLRSFVGGLHMNSYKACFLCSCMVVFLTLCAVKYCPLSPRISLFISICEMVFLSLLKPVENESRPVDEAEKAVFSRRIKQVLVILFFVMLFFYLIPLSSYLVTVTYTLAVIIISMFLGKWKNEKNVS